MKTMEKYATYATKPPHLIAILIAVGTLVPISYMAGREIHYVLSLFLLFAVFFISPKSVIKNLELIYPSIFIIFISTTVTLFYNSSFSDSAKGIMYLSRPALYIVLGASIACILGEVRSVVLASGIGSVIAAIQYIIRYVSEPNVIHSSRTYIRQIIGYGSIIWPVSIFSFAEQLINSRNIKFVSIIIASILIVLIASYLSTSRSIILFFFIILISSVGAFDNKFTGLFSVNTILVLALISTTPILGEVGINFDYKVISSLSLLSEMAPVNQTTISGLNENWRGFETYIAFTRTFSEGSIASIFGMGLAHSVYIGFTFESLNQMRSNIPIFHNGYSFLVVRSGLIGIFIYFVQFNILSLVIYKRLWGKFWSRVGFSIIMFLAFSTPTVSGLYNSDDVGSVLLIILGALAAKPIGKRTHG